MFNFVLKKLIFLVPTFLGASLFAFALIRLAPGDPVLLLLGERGGSPELYQEMQKNLGLDRPLYVQYGIFLTKAIQGDLGVSVVSKRPVWEEFTARFPATLELGFCALFWATILGITLGIWAAQKRNSWIDHLVMGGSLAGHSMPIFWWGLLLIMIFSVQLGLTPVSGRISVIYEIEPVTGFMLIDSWLSGEGFPAFWDALKHLILPSIALGTIPLAVLARMTRSSMLEVIGEDYIKTAKAKGLRPWRIIGLHALRNALVPIVTTWALMAGSLITGAILTETIFSWPGLGRWMVASVTSRDYPVIQGGLLLLSMMVVFIHAGVDVLYAFIDPRTRGRI